jgi:hypothetical protein
MISPGLRALMWFRIFWFSCLEWQCTGGFCEAHQYWPKTKLLKNTRKTKLLKNDTKTKLFKRQTKNKPKTNQKQTKTKLFKNQTKTKRFKNKPKTNKRKKTFEKQITGNSNAN